jgi:outer membrane cobalamin receptor
MGRRIENRKSQETCQSIVPQYPSREGDSRMSFLMSVKPQSLKKVGAFFIHHQSKETCFMQHRWNTVFFSILIFSTLVIASENDTTKTYHANEVVVTATRSAISPSDAPSPVQIISSSFIQQINPTTVADLLRLSNGVYINYYGAVGGVKNLTFRGLSTENSLILINGNPINDPENGSVDLSLISVNSIDRIEVLNGGGSALYGSDALGGVVNIILRHATDDLHAHVQGDLGSFGAARALADVQGRIAGIGILTGISREYGNDDYSFILHRQTINDTALDRKDADYQRTQLYLNGDYQASNIIDVNTSVQYINFERGVPGPVYSVPIVSVARQNDEIFRATFGSHIRLKDSLSISFNGAFNHNSEIYRDSLEPSDALYESKYYSLNCQIDWSPTSWDHLLAGCEYGNGFLDVSGVSWGSLLIMHPVRVQKSLYLANENTFQTEAEWFDRMSFYQSIRYDYYSDVIEDAVSPKLGVNIRIYQPYDIHIRTSWGKNFRVPTFNDKYYPLFSNPNLNPERSTAFDIGIIGALERSGKQTVQVTYFNIDSDKKIAFNGYLPYNIGEAQNSGLEVRYEYHAPDNKLDAFFGFSFTDAIKKNKSEQFDSSYNKQLPYVPKSLGILGISFDTEIGKISVNQSMTGLRYTTADESKSFPAYTVTDASIMKKFELTKVQLILHCSINNVFDVDYQSFEGYPMPGRSFRVSISADY